MQASAQITSLDLPSEWRERASFLRKFGRDERGALLWEDAANELEARQAAENANLLSLSQAAQVCGYSADHLGRMVRDGKLQNHAPAGRRPLVKASDLPRKPEKPRRELTVVAGRSGGRSSFSTILTDAVASKTRRNRGADLGSRGQYRSGGEGTK